MGKIHVNGFIPEKNDKKSMLDFGTKFQPKLAAAASTGEHIIREVTPVSNQTIWPSCTAQVVMDGAEILIGLEDPSKVVQLSTAAEWYFSRRLEGNHKKICGVPLSTAFRAATDIGACPESLHPYIVPPGARDPKTGLPLSQKQWMKKKPSLEARKSMHANKLAGWARIFEFEKALIEAVAFSIYADHPVGFGTAIGNDFRFADGTKVLRPPEIADIIGRHAMLIVGVRIRLGRYEFLLRNSWGPHYALKGYVWVDAAFLTWSEASSFSVGTRSTEILV